jgi:hypothetical protein
MGAMDNNVGPKNTGFHGIGKYNIESLPLFAVHL